MTFALDKFLRFLPAAAFAMVAEFLTGISGSIVCGHVIGEDVQSVPKIRSPASPRPGTM